jgi:hypothetical protein
MYQGGINKEIIINYINSTALPYRLTADGIIYLQTLGLPQEITKAMLQRDGQLQHQQGNQQYYPPQPMPGQGPMPPPDASMQGQQPVQVMAPSTPPPDVTVVGPDYPPYDYGYPYYYGGWPYYGGPVIVGGWWGGGRWHDHDGFHGGGGFRGGGGFGGGHGFGGGGHGGGGGHR